MLNLLLDTLAEMLIDAINDIFRSVMSISITDIMNAFADPAAIGEQLPWFAGLVKVMDWAGWTVLVLASYAAVVRAIAVPFTQKGTSSVAKTVMRIIAAACLIAFRPYVFNILVSLFRRIPSEALAIGKADNVSWFTFKINIRHLLTRFGLVTTLSISELMACVTYMERIISFMMYAYTYPLAVAFGVSDDNSDLAKQWLQGTVSQMLTILLSTYLMNAAVFAFNNVMANGGDNAYYYTVMAIVLFGLCRNSEKILAQYNIRTMQNGDTARSMAGGIGSTFGAAMTAAGIIKCGIQAAGSFIGVMQGTPAPVMTTGSAASYANIAIPASAADLNPASAAGKAAGNAAPVKTKGVRPEDMQMPDEKTMKKQAQKMKVTEPVFSRHNAGGQAAQHMKNQTAVEDFTDAYRKALEERQQYVQKLRNALDNGCTVSAQEAYYGLGLDQVMPWFRPGKGNAEIIDDNGRQSVLISGVEKGKDGKETPVSYLFSPQEHAVQDRNAKRDKAGNPVINPDARVHGTGRNNEKPSFIVDGMTGVNDDLKGYRVTSDNSDGQKMMARSGGYGMETLKQEMHREGNAEAKKVTEQFISGTVTEEQAAEILHRTNTENMTEHTVEEMKHDREALDHRRQEIDRKLEDADAAAKAKYGENTDEFRQASAEAKTAHDEDMAELNRIYHDYLNDRNAESGTLEQVIKKETGTKLSPEAEKRRQKKHLDDVRLPDDEGTV